MSSISNKCTTYAINCESKSCLTLKALKGKHNSVRLYLYPVIVIRIVATKGVKIIVSVSGMIRESWSVGVRWILRKTGIELV